MGLLKRVFKTRIPSFFSIKNNNSQSKIFGEDSKSIQSGHFSKEKSIPSKYLDTIYNNIFAGKGKRSSISPIHKIRDKNRPKNFLIVYFFIFRFTKFLKEKTLWKKLLTLKTYHKKLINDRSYIIGEKLESCFRDNYNEATLLTHYLQKLKEVIKSIFAYIGRKIIVLDTGSNFLFLWNILLTFFLILNLFFIGFKIAFHDIENPFDYGVIVICSIIPTCLLSINILIQLNTSFYSKGKYKRSRKKILKFYISNRIILDLLAILPIFASSKYVIFEVILLLRYFSLSFVMVSISQKMNLRGKAKGVFKLGTLLFQIFYIAHLFACAWIMIGTQSINSDDGWIEKANLSTNDPFRLYINALYFSSVTMITVGYGDISPTNLNEKMYGIIFLFLSCGVFAFSINIVGAIVKQMYKESEDFENFLSNLDFYLEQRKISQNLKIKIRSYLEYMNEEKNRTANYLREKFLSSVSSSLSTDFHHEYYSNYLSKNCLISRFSSQSIKCMSEKIKELTLAPSQIYQFKKEEKNILFILSGKAQLQVSNSQNNFVTSRNLKV